MTLEFGNITDSAAAQIVAHYEAMGGAFYRFTLPSSVFTGVGSSDMISRIQSPANVQWAYAAEPKVSSVMPGRSTVSVDLVAEVNLA